MTRDHLIALSFVESLSRVGLTDRLKADDPSLIELANPLLDTARRAQALHAVRGVHAVAWSDASYPASLATLSDCPPAIWFRGNLEALSGTTVAIVGSRAASATGLETATRLGADLASRGVVVVSGLARGIDSAAHRGALTSGRTIAVLGSGVDVIYPPEHEALADEIARNGLVMSEYPPGTKPLDFHFPARNRLISGLSRAVVLIEAAERSGSLITASCALEQGREVMAVPGNILNGRNRGGHALIRDGAKIVEGADDILEELRVVGVKTGCQNESAGHSVSPAESGSSGDSLLRAMEPGHPYDIDALSGVSGLDTTRLLPRLLDLEMRQLIRRVGGGRFMRSA
jgi:DNA processing protein